MFSGEHIFILSNKIGDVQLALLKKRISENGGSILTKVAPTCTRVISALATVDDVLQALNEDIPPFSARYHSTEWISKSLIRGTKCADDTFALERKKTAPDTKTDFSALVTPHDALYMSPPDSHEVPTTIPPPIVRRTSSAKARFAEMNFGDQSFGLKTKQVSKKRGREDDETPPDRNGSTRTTDEAQRDSFTVHLIRKKVKFSDICDTTKVHKTLDSQLTLLAPGEEFALNYDMDHDDENLTLAPPIGTVAGTYKSKSSSSSNLSSQQKDYLEADEREGPTADVVWFTGSELPRMLEADGATENDDVEDPKFHAILKPAPEPSQRAIEDEIRFQGPWADRLQHNVEAAVKEAFEEDSADEVDGESNAGVGQRREPGVESDEDDFSPSQALIDKDEFRRNFGHQHKPMSAYWERQKANLACQKLPVRVESEPGTATSSPSQLINTLSATTGKVNHNKIITDQLEKLEAICLGSGEKWRGYAYRKAANILKALTYKIESMEDALKLRGIGTSIAEKIGEIISTGKLRKLDALQGEERIQILSTFMGIFGVGQSTANKWCALGYKTLEDIEKHATLTYAQAVGLKYYNEFKLRIPRLEMEAICNAIKRVIHEIDENFIVEICGSYRRGKADCGDIDLIITHKRALALKNILHEVVPKLHEARILTHDFVTISEGSDKYMGVCQASENGVHRRIDMLTVPPAEWPFALIYFTGSGHFNRSMRFWAGKRGYSLSQHGLRVNYGNDNKGPYIAGITTEKQIFEALGLEYRPPEDRDV